ncbi:uncharacterized protein [Littorina saxatilis]|uniref:uncharacterized protein n=1 Tax=Littorina saxatilis TaxID=31220 RepID=UPI0038B68CDC
MGNGETENGEMGNGETENGEMGNGETENGEMENGETENEEMGNGETENGEMGNDQSIDEYHSQTCIRWVARTNEADYVVFKKKTGCYSMVGKSDGGPQELSLMGPCAKKGTAMHEMLHVLGFFHEHSRPDRDQWVEILLQNVQAGKERNFDRLPVDFVDTLGVEYDYGSIMHYSRSAFSYNGQPTLLPKRDPYANLGQRDGFSQKDVEKINKLYRCDLGPTGQNPGTQTTPISQTPPLVTKPIDSPVTKPPVVTRPPIGWTSWSGWSECNMQCGHFRYRYCLNSDHTYCPGSNQEVKTCDPPCQGKDLVHTLVEKTLEKTTITSQPSPPCFFPVAVSLGCWTNEPSSFAIPSVEGLFPKVNDSYHFRVAALRRCADVATSTGSLVFALQNGGQCLTAPDAQITFSTYGPSGGCGNSGKGGANAMNVYSFNKDIDGGWGLWTDWGQCTRSCGGGRKYHYRKCDSPTPIGNGQPCQGRDQEYTSCNNKDCQVASGCGVKYHIGAAGTSGFINVLNYENYMTCEYVIHSGDDDVTVSISVTRMGIEPSVGCIYDALTMYDGANDTDGQLIGAFCGHSPLPRLQSSGPALYIKFNSDSTTTGTGFTLQFVINSKTRMACTQPIKPYHGSFTGSNFVGDTVVFSCNPGNHIVGQSVLRCVDQPGMAVWTDKFPLCYPGRRRRGIANEVRTKCSFEGNLCGFRHDGDVRRRWSIVKGDNSSALHRQRPLADHSGSEQGNFLYVESNRAWRPYDSTRVTSQRYVIDDITPHCLHFWYRVHGNDLVPLHVLQHDDDDVEKIARTFEGESQGEWKEARVDLQPKSSIQN